MGPPPTSTNLRLLLQANEDEVVHEFAEVVQQRLVTRSVCALGAGVEVAQVRQEGAMCMRDVPAWTHAWPGHKGAGT